MTRDELLFKKRELLRQVEAIDQVLEMFPDDTSSGQRGSNGKYGGLSLREAMIKYLSQAGGAMVVSEIAKGVKEGGWESKSPNFTTMVSSTGNRLVEEGKLIRTKKRKKKAFAIPTNNGQQ